ncbi:hypothetical protein [Duganella radicis]|uniref:TraB/GumN family protein n=1 Tax=Duganella radicis TaxID=551988 RepID=A0A6L6PD84_9BURK|nr:hypothetical protein [Duganella radicis]MTV36649.1 hypothetical protein [Duganella radicis]
MRFLRIFILLGILSFPAQGIAQTLSNQFSDAAPPRLWKVQKKNADGPVTTFYFLGATHLGLSVEYDAYFNRVVLPAFATADILLYEGANGREPEHKPDCDPAVLTADGRAFLASARQTVEQVYFNAQEAIHGEQLRAGIDDRTTAEQRRRAAQVFIAGLDEFDLREIYLLYGQVMLDFNGAAAPAGTGQVSRGQVANELRRSRPGLPVRDVDSLYGVHRAYCSAGPERIQFLRSALQAKNSAGDDYLHQVPALEREFVDILSRNKPASGTAPKQFDQLNVLDGAFLCGRNKEWERDILRLDDGKVHFYVLGLKHLFPVDHDGVHCAGLLADLQAVGMTPQIVE